MLNVNSDIHFTYEDYLLLPEERRVELIEGDFFMTPSASEIHQRVSMKLGYKLCQFLQESGEAHVYMAPFDVVLSDENVVQPDIVVVSHDRKAIITEANISGPPDMVVEILSPQSAKRDRIIKKKLYAKYGIREYWIVDPGAQTIEVFIWNKRELTLWQTFPAGSAARSQLFPQVTIEVDSLFTEV
jgi:Uma2 family endonuclease